MILGSAPVPAAAPSANPLKSVRNYLCQLENLDKPGAVDRLAQSGYDMLIVEPTFNIKSTRNFDARAMVKSLHDVKPGRIVLAYLNVGEAEDFRSYWGSEWHATDGKSPMPRGFSSPPTPMATTTPSWCDTGGPDGRISSSARARYWTNLWPMDSTASISIGSKPTTRMPWMTPPIAKSKRLSSAGSIPLRPQ